MDIKTGEVLALGSAPSFDPNMFARVIKPVATTSALTAEENGAPLANRATQGLYPDRLDVQADHRGGGARGGR